MSSPRDAERVLVLVRHGESMWNRANRFTGWTDVDLTERGIDEAHDAARLLREVGLDLAGSWPSGPAVPSARRSSSDRAQRIRSTQHPAAPGSSATPARRLRSIGPSSELPVNAG